MRSSHFIPFALSSLLMVVACSSDDPDDGPQPGSGGAVGTGGSATGGSVIATGGTVNGTGGAGAATGTGGAGAATATGGSFPEDTDTFYATAEEAGLSFGIGVYDFNDMSGSTFMTTAVDGKVCTSGTAQQVVDLDGDGMLEYSAIYGGGLGITMNTMEMVADLTGCTGLSFEIDTVPPDLRVGVLMDEPVDVLYFQPAATPITAGENTLTFEELAVGSWVTDAPEAVDVTRIKDIQFGIPSNDKAPVDFEFCISNIQLIGDCTPPTGDDGTGGSSGTGGADGSGGEGSGGEGSGGEGSGGEGSGGEGSGGEGSGGEGSGGEGSGGEGSGGEGSGGETP